MVPVERLVERVWGVDPPSRARATLLAYLSRLRQVLVGVEAVELVRRSGGYLLAVGGSGVDLHRFRELRAGARDADDERAVRLLAEALGLWRGEALTGLPGEWAAAERDRLARERLAVEHDLVDARLRLGHGGQLVAELAARVEEHPLDERVAGQYVLALHRAGRTADALAHYRRLRERLGDELGTDPGAALQDLHQRILAVDPALEVAARVPVSAPTAPNCLPRDLADFTGRRDEYLAVLDARGPVTAIDGMAGIGKTALAVHVAHALASRHPDGQLFLDLGGGREPLSPRDALEGLLRQVGVAGERIPERVDDCTTLWRSLVADKRLLVVLDNAADAAQVRPLLPNGRHVRTLITSRSRLASLEDVDRVSLDVLPHAEAATLFARVLGRASTGQEDAVSDVLRLCGFLPLAVRITAAKARSHSSWTVAHLADRLRDEHRRLSELRVGDRGVEAAFALSYDQLDAPRRRLFRLLGESPGNDFDAHAAAAVADVGVAEAERSLDALLDAHLVLEPAPGRFRFHDLLRQYARRVAARDEDADARAAARTRLADYYLHGACRAADLLEPARRRWEPGAHTPDLPAPAGRQDAVTWLATERENLVAVVATSSPRHRWQLAQCLWRFFFLHGHLQDWIHTHRLALDATYLDGDVRARAETHKNLGVAHWRRGDLPEALYHHHRALALDEHDGDVWGRAKTHNHLGFIHARMGEYREARHHQLRSVALYLDAGDDRGRARAQIGLGEAHLYAGEPDASRDWFQRAVELARRVGDPWDEAVALLGLGHALGANGRTHLEHALRLTRSTGDRWGEGLALTGLGVCDHLDGATAPALDRLGQAVALARHTGGRWELRMALSAFGRVLSACGRHDEAAAAHGEALALSREMRNPHLEAEVLDDLRRAALPRTGPGLDQRGSAAGPGVTPPRDRAEALGHDLLEGQVASTRLPAR